MGLALTALGILICQGCGYSLTETQMVGALLIGQLIDIEMAIKSLKK